MNTFLIRALVLTLEKFAMKKTLIALAALAVSGAAFAQSTATISGGINVGVEKTGAAGSKAGVASLGGGANAINIITSEDLGGGLTGGFTAQMRFSAATGNMTSAGTVQHDQFLHAANVHLSGGFGTVRVGKVAEAGNCGFDPWGCTGGAALQFGTGVNAGVASGTQANSVSYASPSFSGFSIGYQTSVSTRTDERTVLNIGYTAGPLALSFVQAENGSNTIGTSPTAAALATFGDIKLTQQSIAVGYTLGFGRITLVNTTTELAGTKTADVTSLGLSVPMGATTILAGYNKNSKAAATADTKIALGANYALSKRTSLGADLYKQDAVGGSTGFVARVRHNF
jgi:predicted porin